MKAGQLLLPKIKNTTRLTLYQQGMTDREIAQAIGKSISAVHRWRQNRKLPSNQESLCGVKMEIALSPDQCVIVRTFFARLLDYNGKTGRKDVVRVLQAFRTEVSGKPRNGRSPKAVGQ